MKLGRVSIFRKDRFDTVEEALKENDSFIIIDHLDQCYANYSDPCQEIYLLDTLRLIFQLSIMTLVLCLDRITWPIRRFFKRLFTRPPTQD